jgi:exonuclease III
MGRWTTITLNGKHKQLTIITAYAVSQESGNTLGNKTAYQQQWLMLRQQQETNPNPKQKFYADLTQTIQALERANHDVIVMMDANSPITRNTHMTKLLEKTTLVDIHSNKHGSDPPTTYKRGNRKIDFILGTPSILEYVTKCGILPYDRSDHRMLYIDLNMRGLFGQIKEDTKKPQRILTCINKYKCNIYRNYLQTQIKEHQIQAKTRRIETRLAN